MKWYHRYVKRHRVRYRYTMFGVEFYCECGKVWNGR